MKSLEWLEKNGFRGAKMCRHCAYFEEEPGPENYGICKLMKEELEDGETIGSNTFWDLCDRFKWTIKTKSFLNGLVRMN